MIRISWKSKAASVLAALAIASSGVFAPPPAQARPTCPDEMRRICGLPWFGIRYWEVEHSSLQECADDLTAQNCRPEFDDPGPLGSLREGRPD